MKKKIAVLFGGNSTEYEVSLQSAYSVLKNMDKEKYEIMKMNLKNLGKTDSSEIIAKEIREILHERY